MTVSAGSSKNSWSRSGPLCVLCTLIFKTSILMGKTESMKLNFWYSPQSIIFCDENVFETFSYLFVIIVLSVKGRNLTSFNLKNSGYGNKTYNGLGHFWNDTYEYEYLRRKPFWNIIASFLLPWNRFFSVLEADFSYCEKQLRSILNNLIYWN